MSDTVIQVHNLSKYYRLGTIGTGTLSDDLNRAWAKFRGKPDPTLKIGREENNDGNDHIWALKDIFFEVKQGVVLGIIGRNGAGKSTLLKILSRVTAPTTGECRIKGRIASLLEVGTGFHPELTGRENIFLNGAILGMTKDEIRTKFDEIVTFAEVEKYIDTPVKRYSSGMYVRLAFAVAAHLDPEILLVDEVLAVGDADFQKKCLNKMEDVGRGGRTVLFVSHNMLAVKNLCSQAVVLDKGVSIFQGNVNEAVERYLSTKMDFPGEISWCDPATAPGNHQVRLKALRVVSEGQITGYPSLSKDIEIQIDYWNLEGNSRRLVSIHLFNSMNFLILTTANMKSACLVQDPWVYKLYPVGLFRTTCILPKYLLNTGVHYITLYINGTMAHDNIILERNVLQFDIQDDIEMRKEYSGEWIGAIRPKLDWKTMQIKQDIAP